MSKLSPQHLSQRTPTGQQKAIAFDVGMDGPTVWDPTTPIGGLQGIWDVDTNLISDLVFTNDWLENSNDMSPITPCTPQTSPTYGTLVHRYSVDQSQSSVSDADTQKLRGGSQKARRQAQNRAAQRAYRARKEEQLERSRRRIVELEMEVQRLHKTLEANQWSGSGNSCFLQSRITSLEAKNQILETEYQELKERLRRTAAMLLEPCADVEVYKVAEVTLGS